MTMQSAATVRMFGSLHTWRRERGLETVAEVRIPAGGCPACDVAAQLDLPMEKIEAVFVNHRAYGLNHIVRSGDRIAFVPSGIPAPERLLLGIYRPGSPRG